MNAVVTHDDNTHKPAQKKCIFQHSTVTRVTRTNSLTKSHTLYLSSGNEWRWRCQSRKHTTSWVTPKKKHDRHCFLLLMMLYLYWRGLLYFFFVWKKLRGEEKVFILFLRSAPLVSTVLMMKMTPTNLLGWDVLRLKVINSPKIFSLASWEHDGVGKMRLALYFSLDDVVLALSSQQYDVACHRFSHLYISDGLNSLLWSAK